MRQQTLFLAFATILTLLGSGSKAQAWGAYHAGYTHYGYGGVSHYGRTTAYGPYGAYAGGGVYHYGYGGYSGYRAGYSSYQSPYIYPPANENAYRSGGYHYGSYYGGGYRAGVYRGW